MKTKELLALVVVISVLGGFVGGALISPFGSFVEGNWNISPSAPSISHLQLLEPTIEYGAIDSFAFNATAPGAADFQVTVQNESTNFTIASGTFHDSIAYTDLSWGNIFLFGILSNGTYNVTLTVFTKHDLIQNQTVLTVLPDVAASISGPKNVNDSNKAQTVTFQSHVTGGKGPYKYYWNISGDFDYTPDLQNFTCGSNNTPTFSVNFFLNPAQWYDYSDYNTTYYVTLTVVDSLGYSTDGMFPYSFSPEYTVNVTGY